MSESSSHHRRHKHSRSLRAVGGGAGRRDSTAAAAAEGADGARIAANSAERHRSSTYRNRNRIGRESDSGSAVHDAVHDAVDTSAFAGISLVSGERENNVPSVDFAACALTIYSTNAYSVDHRPIIGQIIAFDGRWLDWLDAPTRQDKTRSMTGILVLS